MKKSVFLTAILMGVVIQGCSSPGTNYRLLTGYESGQKHWCPVEKRLFVPDNESSAADYGVKTSYFCCSKCVDIFKADPDKYSEVTFNENGFNNNGVNSLKGGKRGNSGSSGGFGNPGGGGHSGH